MQLQRSALPLFLKAVHTRCSVRIVQCDTVQIPVLCRIAVPLLGALLRAMAHHSSLTHSERIVKPSFGEQSTRDITREASMSDELSGSLFRVSFCSRTSCSRQRMWDAIACHRTCPPFAMDPWMHTKRLPKRLQRVYLSFLFFQDHLGKSARLEQNERTLYFSNSQVSYRAPD